MKRSADDVYQSRQPSLRSKRRKHDDDSQPAAENPFQKSHPVNALKSRIRSLTRLLAKNDKLPSDLRVEKEQELERLKQEVDQGESTEQRSQVIGKYHQVRFLDRKKAARRLKKAQKQLDGVDKNDDRRQKAEEDVFEAEVDLNYTRYCPLNLPYSSLFPKQEVEDESIAERKGDDKMRELVKQCMADGRLHDLRHGRLTIAPKHHPKPAKQRPKPAKQRSMPTEQKKESMPAVRNDSGSDGGFFY